MSQSDGLLRIALVGCLIALWANPCVGQQPYPRSEERDGQSETSRPAAEKLDSSTLRALFEEVVKLYTAEKRENEVSEELKVRREEAALSAQQDAAYWAMLSAMVAAAALAFNAITIGLVWGTFWETRRTAKAAVKAAQVSERALTSSDQDTQTELRAYVFVKNIVMAVDRSPSRMSIYGGEALGPINTYRFRAELENSGSTPARRVRYCVNSALLENELPADFTFPDSDRVESTVIGPRASIVSTEYLFAGIEIELLKGGKDHLYLWGWVEYNDVFKDTPRHRTEYCFEVIARGWTGTELEISFRPYSRFNGADADCLRQPQS